MKIIDSHLHLAETEGPIYYAAEDIGNVPTMSGLKKELEKNGIEGAVVITMSESIDFRDELNLLRRISDKFKKIRGFCGVSPDQTQREVSWLEKAIKDGYVHGLKVYPAYYPHYPADKIYSRFYSLCIKYDIPVILHTGAVMNDFPGRIYQKYSHPLHVDDLAVDYPELKILMAHAGYPWIIDAAQVACKNANVYMDFSGLKEGVVDSTRMLDKHIRWAIDYVGDDNKIMYGSDWPLIQMNRYIRWLKRVVPKNLHRDFFYQNAKDFFGF